MDSIDVFNDVIKILESITLIEKPMAQAFKKSENLAKNFQEGKVEEAKASCKALTIELLELQKIFKEKTLEPSMELYQTIKKLMHVYVGDAEKQILFMEERTGIKKTKDFLQGLKEKL